VISLLSGHIGRANALAARISEGIGAQPVITTATDVEGLPALDLLAVERGLTVADPRAAKAVSSALLAGERIRLYDPGNHLGLFGSAWEPLFTAMDEPPLQVDATPGKTCNGTDAVVMVSTKAFPEVEESGSRLLLLHPRVLCAGIGCRKGAAAQDILAAIDAVFAESGLAAASLASLASITEKQDEPGLLEAARRLDLPVYFYPVERLATYPVSCPSAKAREMFGIDGVCEPAALAGAGESGCGARLLREKCVSRGVTVAIATRT
jgi:cobalamin biosynthesis protein CbiG